MTVLGDDPKILRIRLESTTHTRSHPDHLIFTLCETFVTGGIYPMIRVLRHSRHQFTDKCKIRCLCVNKLPFLRRHCK